jgi:RecJ-like exonuclease
MTKCSRCTGSGKIANPTAWSHFTCPACQGRGDVSAPSSGTDMRHKARKLLAAEFDAIGLGELAKNVREGGGRIEVGVALAAIEKLLTRQGEALERSAAA